MCILAFIAFEANGTRMCAPYKGKIVGLMLEGVVKEQEEKGGGCTRKRKRRRRERRRRRGGGGDIPQTITNQLSIYQPTSRQPASHPANWPTSQPTDRPNHQPTKQTIRPNPCGKTPHPNQTKLTNQVTTTTTTTAPAPPPNCQIK